MPIIIIVDNSNTYDYCTMPIISTYDYYYTIDACTAADQYPYEDYNINFLVAQSL